MTSHENTLKEALMGLSKLQLPIENDISEKEIKAFQDWAQEKGSEEDPIEFPEDDWEISGEAITLRLKAFIGRNTYSQSTFYRVIGDLNEALNEAIEILNDGRFENSKLAHNIRTLINFIRNSFLWMASKIIPSKHARTNKINLACQGTSASN